MILGSEAIKTSMAQGYIKIDPPGSINPNSVDLHLDEEIYVVTDKVIDPKAGQTVERVKLEIDPRISGQGSRLGYRVMLLPRNIYLGQTREWTETRNLVPCLEGKSSLARMGVSVHTSAGFGDVGFCGRWTLELTVVKPTYLYIGMPICQIYYHDIIGIGEEYNGHYQAQERPRTSRRF
jgi:dCTP deaminase